MHPPRPGEDPAARLMTLQRILESIKDPIFSVDTNYRYTSFNRRHAETLAGLYGTVAEEGKSLLDCLTVPADRERAKSYLDRALGGETVTVEEFAGDEGRSRVYIEIAHFPVRDEAGQVVGAAVFCREVTERHRVVDALRASEQVARALINATSDNAVLVDVEGRVLAANAMVAGSVGNTPEGLVGADLFAHFGPVVGSARRAFAEQVVRTGKPVQFVDQRNGRWFESTFYPVFDESGSVTQVAIFARDTTDARRSEEALRSQLSFLEAILNAIPSPTFYKDADCRYQGCNRAFLTFLGVSREQIVGKTAFDLAPPDLAATYDTMDRALLASGGAQVYESPTRAADGSMRDVVFNKVAYRNADGSLGGIVGVMIDITDRKQAEEALRAGEERYRALFDQSPLGIYRTTPDGRILAANAAMLQVLGYESFEDLASRNLAREGLGPEYDRAAITAALERDGEVRGLQSVWTAKNGMSRFVRENARVVRGPDGAVLYYEGTVEDITESMALEEDRRRLAAAIEQAAEAVVITDALGRIQYVNPAFERVTGYARQETMGKTPAILKSGHHGEAFYAAMWQAISRGETWQGHLINRRKDGTLYEEEATISPIRNASGVVQSYVSVKRDVTREVALQAQLRQSQKMEAVGQLAGGVAHDFNNLLQGMLSQTQLLRQRHSAPEAELLTNELERQVKRGASLTRQLLLFSRRETAKPERLDLNDVMRDATTMLVRLARANIALSIELSPGPLTVEADRGQLDQVLLNLAVNAFDAMPQGGRLTIRTGEGPGQTVWLSVEDSGHGILDAIRERIFEPFFTTKASGIGTGLGLSVVKGIVDNHSGLIEVASVIGEGSTFRVILPRAAVELPASERGPQEVARLEPGHGERILVVEDEDIARDGLRQILAGLGYDVVATASGEEAGKLGSDQPFHLLLTDLMLPGISGPALAKRLRARWPRLEVIMMSGYTEDEAVRRGVSAGEVRFLQKPFDMATLAREIRAALDGQRNDP
jgi:two-component system, cell cycle sensor histidine kinase and response regulator CckA